MLQSLWFISPEVVLLLTAFVVLVGGAWKARKMFLGSIAFLGFVLSALLVPLSLQAGGYLFYSMLVNDGFSLFFRGIILIMGAMTVLLSMGYEELEEADGGEYYFFVLILTLAMMLAVSTKNLMMMYLSLETVSIISYIMAGYLKRDAFSSEAGIKYFLFGVLSTGISLYGVSLLYGIFGTLDLNVITAHLVTNSFSGAAVMLSAALVLAGFGFKCSLFPFHMWTPDVYQGAPTPVAAFFSVGPKAMGFAFLLRVFVEVFQGVLPGWLSVVTLIAVMTMFVGNLTALGQTHIKRLLAYSTIAQAGYILIGLIAGTAAGIKAVLFYLFVYALMNLGAFGAVIMAYRLVKSDEIEDYAGLYKKDPFTAVALAVCLLSLAGIPPLAGFLAKFFILAAAIEAKLFSLVIIALANSVIALYYYVKVIKYMFLRPAQNMSVSSQSPALKAALLVTVALNIILGVWPHFVISWLSKIY